MATPTTRRTAATAADAANAALALHASMRKPPAALPAAAPRREYEELALGRRLQALSAVDQASDSATGREQRQDDPDCGRAADRSHILIRVLQRILALTAAIWDNDRTGQTIKRSRLAYNR